MNLYDEALFYACREYVTYHDLFHRRTVDQNAEDNAKLLKKEMPLRWWLLLIYERPFISRLGTIYFVVQGLLTIGYVVVLLYKTAPAFSDQVFPYYGLFWLRLDMPLAALFTLDLLMNFFLLPNTANDYCRTTKIMFLKRFHTYIDIVSILPSYLGLLNYYNPGAAADVRFLASLRVLRFLRTARLLHSIEVLFHTFEKSFKPLLGPIVFIFPAILAFSTIIYFSERGTYDPASGLFLADDCDCLTSAPRQLNPNYPCPQVVTKFVSIPATMWFVFATITTLGYGDVVPVCYLGKAFSVVCMFLGIALTAMPLAIVGTFYTNTVMRDVERRNQRVDTAILTFGISENDDLSTLPVGATVIKRLQQEASRGGRSSGEMHRPVTPRKSGDSNFGSPNEESLENAPHGAERLMTIGERLLSVMASAKNSANSGDHDDDDLGSSKEKAGLVFDLFSPRADVVYRVNNFLRQEFFNIVQQLSTSSGVERFRKKCLGLHAPIDLVRVSAPDSTVAPRVIPLLGMTSAVVGIRRSKASVHIPGSSFGRKQQQRRAGGGGFSHQLSAASSESHQGSQRLAACDASIALESKSTQGFPTHLFRLDTDRSDPSQPIFLSPIFPAVVAVNGSTISPLSAPLRVSNGDLITISRAIGAPVEFQLLIVEGGTSSVRVVLSSSVINPSLRVLPPSPHSTTRKIMSPSSTGAASQQNAYDDEEGEQYSPSASRSAAAHDVSAGGGEDAGLIEISVEGAPVEYRNLRFRDYAHRQSGGGQGSNDIVEYSDL